MSKDQLPPGASLGAFEIIAFVAAGGMGSVYKVRNTLTDEIRALKVILPELSSNKDFVKRFVREIKIAASVDHPNLVRVFEPAIENGVMFLPMELLQGQPLSARVRRGATFSAADALSTMIPVCRAVSALHAKGIIHRDLKPANVFMAVDAQGREVPKVLDFGAARIVDTAPEERTSSGTIIGTEYYMPFEQAAGLKDVDARADEYALGVMLYQMLCGRRPYENDDAGRPLVKVLGNLPFPRPSELVPGIAPELESIVLRAIAWDRKDRFASVVAFSDALESFGRRSFQGADPELFGLDSSAPAGRATESTLLNDTAETGRASRPNAGPEGSGRDRTMNSALQSALSGTGKSVSTRPAEPSGGGMLVMEKSGATINKTPTVIPAERGESTRGGGAGLVVAGALALLVAAAAGWRMLGSHGANTPSTVTAHAPAVAQASAVPSPPPVQPAPAVVPTAPAPPPPAPQSASPSPAAPAAAPRPPQPDRPVSGNPRAPNASTAPTRPTHSTRPPGQHAGHCVPSPGLPCNI